MTTHNSNDLLDINQSRLPFTSTFYVTESPEYT